MNDKVFLDTNVLVYAWGPNEAARSRIAQDILLEALAAQTANISYQVVQEFLNLALRKFTKVIPQETAAQYLQELVVGFKVLPWSLDLMEAGLSVHARYRFSWYDSLIVAAALQSGCSILYTEDLQSGQVIEGLTVVNPFLAAPLPRQRQ